MPAPAFDTVKYEQQLAVQRGETVHLNLAKFNVQELKRLADGTFAPKGLGTVLKAGDEVKIPHEGGTGFHTGKVHIGHKDSQFGDAAVAEFKGKDAPGLVSIGPAPTKPEEIPIDHKTTIDGADATRNPTALDVGDFFVWEDPEGNKWDGKVIYDEHADAASYQANITRRKDNVVKKGVPLNSDPAYSIKSPLDEGGKGWDNLYKLDSPPAAIGEDDKGHYNVHGDPVTPEGQPVGGPGADPLPLEPGGSLHPDTVHDQLAKAMDAPKPKLKPMVPVSAEPKAASPMRGPSGKLRNVKGMLDSKLNQTTHDMRVHMDKHGAAGDLEGAKALLAERANRPGLPEDTKSLALREKVHAIENPDQTLAEAHKAADAGHTVSGLPVLTDDEMIRMDGIIEANLETDDPQWDHKVAALRDKIHGTHGETMTDQDYGLLNDLFNIEHEMLSDGDNGPDETDLVEFGHLREKVFQNWNPDAGAPASHKAEKASLERTKASMPKVAATALLEHEKAKKGGINTTYIDPAGLSGHGLKHKIDRALKDHENIHSGTEVPAHPRIDFTSTEMKALAKGGMGQSSLPDTSQYDSLIALERAHPQAYESLPDDTLHALGNESEDVNYHNVAKMARDALDKKAASAATSAAPSPGSFKPAPSYIDTDSIMQKLAPGKLINEGPGGKPRNVKQMADGKLWATLRHPHAEQSLKERVIHELKSRGYAVIQAEY